MKLASHLISADLFTPTNLSPKLWLNASDLNLGFGAYVTSWPDSSGNGNTCSASGPPNFYPDYLHVFNGYPSVRFNGTSTSIVIPDAVFTGVTSGEAFIVVKDLYDPPSDPNKTGLWVLGPVTGNYSSHFPWTDGVIYDSFGTTVRKTTANPTLSLEYPTRLYNVRSAPNAWSNHLNGTQLYSTTTNTVGWPETGAARLGKGRGPNSDDYWFNGEIAEFVFFNSVLSTGNRIMMNQYFATKYALAIA